MIRKWLYSQLAALILLVGFGGLIDPAGAIPGGGWDAKKILKDGTDGYSDSLRWSMAGTYVYRDTLVAADNDTTSSIQIAGARRISVVFTKRDVQGTAGGGCSLRVIPQISNDNVNFVDLTHPSVVFSNFSTGQTTAAGIGRYVIPLLNLDAPSDTTLKDTTMSGAVANATAVTVTNKSAGTSFAAMQIAGARFLRFRAVILQGNNDSTPYTGGTLDSLFLSGAFNISFK